jgi:integrase
MRLPNGFGSVTKLSGKRRNPWRARVTIGWENVTNPEDGKITNTQIYANVGCYEKKLYAMQALNSYHNNPQVFVALLELYKRRQITLDELLNLQKPKTTPEKIIKDVDKVGTTFEQLHTLWRADSGKYGGANKRKESKYYYDQAFNLCEQFHHMYVDDISLNMMQSYVDNSDRTKSVMKYFKLLMKAVYTYAVIKDIITPDQNKTEYIDLSTAKEVKKNPRTRFSTEEINLLWDYVDNDEYTSVALMLIYSGVRISELLNLKKINVHIEERYFEVTDSKTKSGIRIVPIAEKVVAFFEHWMIKDSEYLITGKKDQHVSHTYFRENYWLNVMQALDLKHKPHDTRHTCASLLKTAKIQSVIIKKILGHKSQDITDDVYTEFEIAPLLEAINLI